MSELSERDLYLIRRAHAAGAFDYDPLSGEKTVTREYAEVIADNAPAALTWGDGPPTEPGWYWVEFGPVLDVYQLCRDVGGVYFKGLGIPRKEMAGSPARYAGPIPLPEIGG